MEVGSGWGPNGGRKVTLRVPLTHADGKEVETLLRRTILSFVAGMALVLMNGTAALAGHWLPPG